MKKLSLFLLSFALLALLIPAQHAAATNLAVEIQQISCTQDSPFTNTTTLEAVVSGQVCLNYEFKWENATPTIGNQATSTGGDRTVTVAVKCGTAIAYDSITLGQSCEI